MGEALPLLFHTVPWGFMRCLKTLCDPLNIFDLRRTPEFLSEAGKALLHPPVADTASTWPRTLW